MKQETQLTVYDSGNNYAQPRGRNLWTYWKVIELRDKSHMFQSAGAPDVPHKKKL